MAPPLEAWTSLRCVKATAQEGQEGLVPRDIAAHLPSDTDLADPLAPHIPLFAAHVDRLVRTTRALCELYPDTWTKAWSADDVLACDAMTQLRTALADAHAPETQLRASLRIHADGTTRAIIAPMSSMQGTPLVRLDTQPVLLSTPTVQYKTNARAAYDEARHRVHGTLTTDGCFDVILWHDDSGDSIVTESSIANIVIEKDGALVTPSFQHLLPGLLIQHLVQHGVVTQATVTVRDVQNAPRLWLCNAVRGMFQVALA